MLLACVYFSLFANGVFWQSAAPHPWTQWRWTLSLFLLVTAAHGVWLSLLVWRRTARVVLSALVVVAAIAGHYMAAYGIYIDADMVRNVLHTDWREASELMGVDAALPVLAAMPALVVIWRVRIRERTWRRALGMRAAFLAGVVAVGVLGVLPSTQQLTAFLRNQREVRYLVTPANVLVCIRQVWTVPYARSQASRRAIMAPIGIIPPPSDFAIVSTSGSTPSCSQANSAPVRPNPVWTSSTIRSVPVLRHNSSACLR